MIGWPEHKIAGSEFGRAKRGPAGPRRRDAPSNPRPVAVSWPPFFAETLARTRKHLGRKHFFPRRRDGRVVEGAPLLRV